MLEHTFLHIPGIGYVTENRLWTDGFLTWRDYFEREQCCSLSSPMRQRVSQSLGESVEALAAGDARHFETRLPPGEMWRLYPEFKGKIAFLDIETTGLYPYQDVITMIGLFDGNKTKVFIRGINMKDFADEIKKYSLLITFNGKRFDIPFIRHTLGELPDYQGQIDLLYPLGRLGYRGGLKAIERRLGLEREGALQDVDGFIAVLLWYEYQRGNRAALDTLIRYNLEDVVNLQYLMEFAYNELLGRLTIPVPLLKVQPKPVVDCAFDPDLIAYLKQRARLLLWDRY